MTFAICGVQDVSIHMDFLTWQIRATLEHPPILLECKLIPRRLLVLHIPQNYQGALTPKSKWKMHRRYFKFQSQDVQIFGYVYRNRNGQNHGPVWKIRVPIELSQTVFHTTVLSEGELQIPFERNDWIFHTGS